MSGKKKQQEPFKAQGQVDQSLARVISGQNTTGEYTNNAPTKEDAVEWKEQNEETNIDEVKVEPVTTVTPQPTELENAYDYYNNFVNDYSATPLTEEELNKRKRAAMAVQGVGALGNVANAISNLIYVGKGAPSQELPKNVDASAALGKMEEEERAKRNEVYQRAKDRVATAQAKEALAYKKESDARNYQLKAAEYDLKYKEGLAKLEKIGAEIHNLRVKGMTEEANALEKQYRAMEAYVDATYAEKQNIAEIEQKRASAYSSQMSGQKSAADAATARSKETTTLKYGTGRNDFSIPTQTWNNLGALGDMASALGIPLEVKTVVDPQTKEHKTWLELMGNNGKAQYLTKEQVQMLIGSKLTESDDARVQTVVQRYGINAPTPSTGAAVQQTQSAPKHIVTPRAQGANQGTPTQTSQAPAQTTQGASPVKTKKKLKTFG